MSEIEALRKQVEQLTQQLQHAQQLTALGELVSTTTHEFNNVMMTIINYAKFGLHHKDTPTRDKALEKIYNAANRASRITNGVLGVARNRNTGREPTDLTTLVEDCLLLLEREMNKYRIKVEKSFAEVPEVHASGNQIQQVLLNLLINARQAMPNGGRLALKIWQEQPDMVQLMVRDYGTGIPAESLPKIFDAFYSTKDGPDASGKGGTGLGLAACRDIIESHQGRIRVESTVGKGTAFTLLLPTVEKAKEQMPQQGPKIIGMPIDAPMATDGPAAHAG